MISMVSELVQLSDEVEKTIFDRGGVLNTSIGVLKLLTLVQILWCALFSLQIPNKIHQYDYHDIYKIEFRRIYQLFAFPYSLLISCIRK